MKKLLSAEFTAVVKKGYERIKVAMSFANDFSRKVARGTGQVMLNVFTLGNKASSNRVVMNRTSTLTNV